MADLAKENSAFEQKNLKLVVVGSGDVAHFQEFRRVTNYAGELVTDPERKSFRILGFPSGIGGLLGLNQIKRGFSALASGIRPGSLQGNALQLGGAVVISGEGELLYQFVEREAGDHPPVHELLNSV